MFASFFQIGPMFSKACEYAIRAMVFLASVTAEGERLTAREVARATHSPEAFTAKTLQALVKAGILASVKGPGGGFLLPRRLADRTRLSDIVSAIDGHGMYTGCGLGLRQCSATRPCP
jgi:Rrf2 family protein